MWVVFILNIFVNKMFKYLLNWIVDFVILLYFLFFFIYCIIKYNISYYISIKSIIKFLIRPTTKRFFPEKPSQKSYLIYKFKLILKNILLNFFNKLLGYTMFFMIYVSILNFIAVWATIFYKKKINMEKLNFLSDYKLLRYPVKKYFFNKFIFLDKMRFAYTFYTNITITPFVFAIRFSLFMVIVNFFLVFLNFSWMRWFFYLWLVIFFSLSLVWLFKVTSNDLFSIESVKKYERYEKNLILNTTSLILLTFGVIILPFCFALVCLILINLLDDFANNSIWLLKIITPYFLIFKNYTIKMFEPIWEICLFNLNNSFLFSYYLKLVDLINKSLFIFNSVNIKFLRLAGDSGIDMVTEFNNKNKVNPKFFRFTAEEVERFTKTYDRIKNEGRKPLKLSWKNHKKVEEASLYYKTIILPHFWDYFFFSLFSPLELLAIRLMQDKISYSPPYPAEVEVGNPDFFNSFIWFLPSGATLKSGWRFIFTDSMFYPLKLSTIYFEQEKIWYFSFRPGYRCPDFLLNPSVWFLPLNIFHFYSKTVFYFNLSEVWMCEDFGVGMLHLFPWYCASLLVGLHLAHYVIYLGLV